MRESLRQKDSCLTQLWRVFTYVNHPRGNLLLNRETFRCQDRDLHKFMMGVICPFLMKVLLIGKRIHFLISEKGQQATYAKGGSI
jgi:hypothetical protein